MFYKKYKITNDNDDNYNNISIMRFSYNHFYNDDDVYEYTDDEIKQLLNNLQLSANEDIKCYNHIYPWKDINTSSDSKNKEILIAYNNETNHIQAWCNFSYSTFSINNVPSNLYTLTIDKLVSRASPKIKFIGLLLLEFIRDECIKKPIKYFHDNPKISSFKTYEDINIDIMYLYSLTTSIDFYKKTFLTQLHLPNPQDINYEIFKHVFIYLLPKHIDVLTRKNKINLMQLNILHSFECNSVLSPETITMYNEFKDSIPLECNNPKPVISGFISLTDIDYPINIKERIFSIRKRRHPEETK